MRWLRATVLLGLVLAACGGGDEPATTSAPLTAPPPDTTAPDTTAPDTTAPVTEPATTTVDVTVDVAVYFLRDQRLVIAHRQVEGPEVLRGALAAVLAGPTGDETLAGMVSTIPAGTGLAGVDLADGIATVDLTSQFESGGGTLSMTARVAQIVFTATQFDDVDAVLFWLDGTPIEFLGGEGLILDTPQTRADVNREFTGGVIVDTPAPGDTVSSPFTVTGEGDVFEGEFPIEVWAAGELVGGVAPVRAGAWGAWADFEATITLDAPAGPIELIAYDAGGCGPGPDCPPVIRTVVALDFTG